jgi:hypothetical protein
VNEGKKKWVPYTSQELQNLAKGTKVVLRYEYDPIDHLVKHETVTFISGGSGYSEVVDRRGETSFSQDETVGYWYVPRRDEIHDILGYDESVLPIVENSDLKTIVDQVNANPKADNVRSGTYSISYGKIWRGNVVIGYVNPDSSIENAPKILPTSRTSPEEADLFANEPNLAPPEPANAPAMSIDSPEGKEAEAPAEPSSAPEGAPETNSPENGEAPPGDGGAEDLEGLENQFAKKAKPNDPLGILGQQFSKGRPKREAMESDLIGVLVEDQESIAYAAIRTPDGKVFTGFCHYEAALKATEEGAITLDDFDEGNCKEGFVTTSGKFLDRRQALILAKKANKNLSSYVHDENDEYLASEDLVWAESLDETRRKYFKATAALEFDIEAKGTAGGESIVLYLLPVVRSAGKYELYDFTVTSTSSIPSLYAVETAISGEVTEAIPFVTVNKAAIKQVSRRVHASMKAAKDVIGGFSGEESTFDAIDRYLTEESELAPQEKNVSSLRFITRDELMARAARATEEEKELARQENERQGIQASTVSGDIDSYLSEENELASPENRVTLDEMPRKRKPVKETIDLSQLTEEDVETAALRWESFGSQYSTDDDANPISFVYQKDQFSDWYILDLNLYDKTLGLIGSTQNFSGTGDYGTFPLKKCPVKLEFDSAELSAFNEIYEKFLLLFKPPERGEIHDILGYDESSVSKDIDDYLSEDL